MDRQGIVRGSFEGVVGEQELSDAVKAIPALLSQRTPRPGSGLGQPASSMP